MSYKAMLICVHRDPLDTNLTPRISHGDGDQSAEQLEELSH